jgi:hypothetical protein
MNNGKIIQNDQIVLKPEILIMGEVHTSKCIRSKMPGALSGGREGKPNMAT